MSHSWDPAVYRTYAGERDRPFHDLTARVPAREPRRVVDLGCGTADQTATLLARWPDAHVVGIDASEAMIERARHDHPDLDLRRADLRDHVAAVEGGEEPRADVVVSNATLQWLPDHLDLLPRLVGVVAPGGHLAIQVPANFEEPSHTLRRDLAAESPYVDHVRDVAAPSSHEPAAYLVALADAGCAVDVWETTYLHLLDPDGSDPDPVFTWVSATGARPTLQALPDDLRPSFETEFKRRLRLAYPRTPHGVLLPFRRIFAVARVPG